MHRAVQARIRRRPAARNHHLAVRPQFRCALQPLDIGQQAAKVGEAAFDKGHQRALGADIQFGDARGAAIDLGLDDLQQIGGLGRNRAEPVDHLGGEAVDRRTVVELAEPAVQSHPQIQIGNIGFGNEDRRLDADLRRIFLAPDMAARFLLEDRFLEHRLVQFEPDLLDMPRLLVAEQVARSAKVEIVARQLKSGAKAVEIGQHVQPLGRGLGQNPVGGGQIGIGPCLRPPDPPAQLV